MTKREKIRIEIQTLKKLPTLSHSAMKILNLTEDESTHLDELLKIIENDPPMLSKVLGVANILYLGYGYKITTVKDALFKIGFNTLRNITFGISIFSLFKSSRQKEITYRKLFKHSIATGVISKFISENIFDYNDDTAFTCGMLHDIGLFALHYLKYEAYVKIENLVLQGKTIAEAENEVIDLDHSIIGKWLSEWWGLPEEIGEVILYHHENPATLDNKYLKNIALVHLSGFIAERIGFGIFDGFQESIFYEYGIYSIFTLPEINELINYIKNNLPFDEINII